MTTKKGPEALEFEALDAVTGGTGVRNVGSATGGGTVPSPGDLGLLNPDMVPDLAANLPINQPFDRGGDQQPGGEADTILGADSMGGGAPPDLDGFEHNDTLSGT